MARQTITLIELATREAALYATRASAVRAARQTAKAIFGKAFEAHEGPDFIIHPVPVGFYRPDRFKFQFRTEALAEALCT